MSTRSGRRTRREQRRRLEAVGGTCLAALALALVLASCGTGSSSTTVAAPAPRRPILLRRAAARVPIRALIPTTTTTTRPAVNPDTGPPPANTGVGRRIIYCNSCQTVWLVEADNYVTASYRVSGRTGTPNPGEYHVFRKLEMGRSKSHPDLRLPWFSDGFARGDDLWRLSVPQTTEPLNVGDTMIDWLGGQRWVWAPAGDGQRAQKLRAAANAAGGNATLFVAAHADSKKSIAVFDPLKPPLDTIHHRLKAEFDPANIFGRNRLFPSA